MTVITEPSVKTELPRTCSIIQRATVTPADLSALVSLSLSRTHTHTHSVIEILENRRNFEKSDRFFFSPAITRCGWLFDVIWHGLIGNGNARLGLSIILSGGNWPISSRHFGRRARRCISG